MIRFCFVTSFMALAFISTNVMAQHSDIEFGYDDTGGPTALVIEQDNVTIEGFQFFEAEFDEFLGDFFAEDPGFTTNEGEGLLVNPGDQIWLNFLDASSNSAFGVGYVNYYNPNTDMLEALGSLEITDNGGAPTANLILDGGSIVSGANPQLIGIGDVDGDIHDHITFDLLDDGTAPFGAYGVLVQLQSDFETFALPRFGVASIPEPGSFALLTPVALGFLLRRRRKSKVSEK